MSVTDRYQYEEENKDVLAREPFIVQFRRRSARRMYECELLSSTSTFTGTSLKLVTLLLLPGYRRNCP